MVPWKNSQSNVKSNNIVSTHFMRAEAEFINSDFISNQNIKNCFGSMKPSKNEVLEYFNSSVNFKDGGRKFLSLLKNFIKSWVIII